MSRRYVPPEERRERDDAIERLLVAGLNRTRINSAMAERYGMSRSAVDNAIRRVRARWVEEERENRPSYKAAAIRRLVGHVAEARQAKNWASVAQLERLLAEIQGTREPMEVQVNLDISLPEAAMRVVAALPPDRFRALIDEQRRIRALAATTTVETTGKVKEDE